MQLPQRLDRRHPFRQWKTWSLPGGQVSLTGYSRANDKTFFHVPELRCCLDAGLAEGRQPDTVLLTHTHLDHSKDLDYLATKDGVEIYLPAESLPYAAAYLRATSELNFGADYDPSMAGGARLHGVRAGEEFTFGRRGHAVRVVGCRHKVPSVGYGISAPNPKAPDQAKRLFVFLGDTDPVVFAENPWLFEYPVIVTECTFLDDAQRERAHRVGHTLWSELRPIVEAHPDHLFVLTHFSLRHSDAEVVEFFERQALPNVLPWAHPQSVLREQHQ